MRQVAVDPDRIYWDDHVQQGREARQQRDGAQWRLGDLAAAVETIYGEGSLQKYAEEIGVEYETLRRYRSVATTFGNGNRIPNLSWTHHLAVQGLDEPEPWLRMAAHEGWSVARLRQEIENTRAEAERLAREEAGEMAKFTTLDADDPRVESLGRMDGPSGRGRLAPGKPFEITAPRHEQIANRAYERFGTVLGGLAGYRDGLATFDVRPVLAVARPDEIEEWVRTLSDVISVAKRVQSALKGGM